MTRVAVTAFGGILIVSAASHSAPLTDQDIEKVVIEGATTANDKPVGTFNSPVSNLEYDPRVDLQSRNMAEAQADVTIRGGIFENTGFRVGAATLFDPQTGHYFAEIPIAPEMLTAPAVLTGVDNALYGVNSSVGTIAYSWRPVRTGGSVSLGLGTNDFRLQRLHAAHASPLDDAGQWQLGIEGEFAHSQSDGTIANGDHDFERINARLQLTGVSSQTDVFYGAQNKFFGWPNMYTPFNVNETEALDTRLVMFNHQQRYGQDSGFELTAYSRNNTDHYVFSRENPDAFQSFHETDVYAAAWSGHHVLHPQWAVNYAGQFMVDAITSTTLENTFTERNYYKVSVVPEYQTSLAPAHQLTLRVGAAFDDTNRDASRLSVLGDATLTSETANNGTRTIILSYAEATQVAGYTAIGGSTDSGLFRSNNMLQREVSKNLELALSLDQHAWRLDSAIFYRWDQTLTDWTYSFDATSARAANPVDIDTLGVEVIAVTRLDSADLVASYTYLDKSEDYRDASIDASFYALNYPPHRLTLGATWYPTDAVTVKIDNEWRKQADNALRRSGSTAFFTHLTVTYTPPQLANLSLVLAADNLWDEAFEEIPGTPGRSDQFSATLTYVW
ncbi:TonB-dependent receptor plug domain-containing protein [Alteromonas halophila]|uniref:TonB-dependent receptor n=1 Tax=Alteromonas halophila TaxID=516698 RepID=A0A918JPF8_9ALTE|nr:TonB-dependent receptor [Alteromonas halophila]GGW93147.1 hypothetical protein GCM10007391_29300 [Alteromonas halophila]